MRSKIFIIFIAVVLMLSSGCSLLDTKSDNDAQIRALETQNALLAQQIEAIQQQDQAGNTNDGGAVPQPAKGDSEPLEQKPREPESLPTEPVKSGTPIVYDGWQLIVNSEISLIRDNRLGLTLYLKNLTDNNRIFRYTNASITMGDDIGTEYPYVLRLPGYSSFSCEPFVHEVKNVEVKSDDTVEIKTSSWFDNCDSSKNINSFSGPIPREAKQVFVYINDFGPFSGITVVIDL